MKVYVKSQSGKWLMPTNPANARILLKQGKAKVIQRTPFTIQLLYETTEYIQPVTVGIDDGGIHVGIAAVSHGQTLFQQEMVLRSDIKSKLDTRRQYRRSRRYRKTRYRKPRFLNRKQSIPTCKVCGNNAPASRVICRPCLKKAEGVYQEYAGIQKKVFRIPPSIKAKKKAIIRVVKQIPLPISKIILEDVYFDFQAMENPDISGKQYQHGSLFYHKNFKQACLVRDKFKCRVCGAESKLQCHHIKPRTDGGTDKLSNLMTLCENCHEKHHKDNLKLPKQKSAFYISAAHVQQGKNYLQAELSKIAPLRKTFGYITAHHRNKARIEKSHVNDAVIIAEKQATPLDRQIQTKHVRSRKRSLHEATARKGRKAPNQTQKRNNKNVFTLKGFNRWDTVQYKGRVGFISGFTGTSSCRIVDIKGNYIKNPEKKYTQVNLREVRKIHENKSIVSYYANESTTFAIAQEGDSLAGVEKKGDMIYTDNNATTRVADEVIKEMLPYLGQFYGNPSSMYGFADSVNKKVRQARARVADLINADPGEIIFTACGTESDNAAINAGISAFPQKKHIITTAVEHPAIRNLCFHLQKKKGYEVTFVPVDKKGRLDLDTLYRAMSDDTAVVSVMWANNETGVIFPIAEIAKKAKEKGIWFHTDAVQAVGKIPIDVKAAGVDMLSLSGHKIHAPKGIGALYVRKGIKFSPFLIGGHQEKGRRGGTENTASIIALGKACELAKANLPLIDTQVRELRDYLENRLLNEIPATSVNGDRKNRLPNTLSIGFDAVEGESILMLMNQAGICASSGSACTSGSLDPSHVLIAMQVPFKSAHGTIRFSLSHYNTKAEMDTIVETLIPAIDKLRQMSPFWKDGKVV